MKIRRLLIGCCLLFAPGARADDVPVFDPKAKGVLDAMVRAYRDLRTLDQETTYSEDAPGGLARSRLVAQRPNKILLEVLRKTPGRPQPVVTRVLCDGKELFTYQEAQGWYTREEAPKNFAGFRGFASSLEMAMLIGIDPFVDLLQQARALRLGEPVLVDAVMTDVALIDIGDEDRTGEARLYVGQQDHLLRRFVFESKVIPKPEPPQPMESMTPPDPDAPPAGPLPPRVIAFQYDNRVFANKEIVKSVFTWSTPPGALLYQDTNSLLAPQPQKGRASVFTQGKPLDVSKPTKPLSQRDLFKMARKQKRRK